MEFIYVNRESYRDKQKCMYALSLDLDAVYIIPEGGANELALKGCAEIVDEIDSDFDYICQPVAPEPPLQGFQRILKHINRHLVLLF